MAKRERRPFFKAGLAGLTIGLFTGACVLPAAAEKLAPLNPSQTVKVATVAQASDAALYIAVEKGYFKELGLNVEFVTFQSAATMVAPLGSGELDVGGGAVSAGLWNAELRKLGVKAVADKGSTRKGFSYFGMAVKKDSLIHECKDVKGKNLSNASTSNGLLHSIEMWLQTCGLSLKDVKLKTMSYSDVVPALSNGAIDIGHLGEPLITINEKNGLIRVVKRQYEMRPSEQVALLYFSQKFRDNVEAARRFMVAYVRASQDYQKAFDGKAPAEWYVKIMQKHTRAKDAALYPLMKPAGLDPWGQMDMKSMREDYNWFKERKLIISKEVKFEDPFDTSFLDFAKDYIQKSSP
jgi:NitT/TauT family transport system substrate-binding protein